MNLFEQLVLGKTAQDMDMGMSGMEYPQTEDDQIQSLVDNLDMTGLSNEELLALAQQAREQEMEQEEDYDEEGAYGGIQSPKMASAEEVVDYEKLAEQLEYANDFFGRVRARAFWDELEKISQAEGEAPMDSEMKDKEKKKEKEDETEKEARSQLLDALQVISKGL